MARTAEMKLIELMVLKQDINRVIEYIGRKGSFQFQSGMDRGKENGGSREKSLPDIDGEFFDRLQKIASSLGIPDRDSDLSTSSLPTDDDRTEAGKLLCAYDALSGRMDEAVSRSKKVNDAYKEALAFSNLQVPYSELEHLSFISLKIGKIAAENFEPLRDALCDNAVVVPLGDDRTHILVATSKRGRFALETELKNVGFVNMEIPSDFKGVPADVLDGLKKQKKETDAYLDELEAERRNFADTHTEIIHRLLGCFSIGMQVAAIEGGLQSTGQVYRITGWIPSSETDSYMKELDELTESRIAIREYSSYEVPSVLSGKEQVPVKLNHGKFISSFERMIFSYGSPVYGTIDPTPFVAVFFTLLFGIMFGDCGQGLVFLVAGILMARNVIKVGGWNKFAPIFIAIGISSTLMGLLTGEFFSNETLLEPFALRVTGFFGAPHAPILKLMPSSDPSSIKSMFGIFGVAVAIGFVINTIGLVINIVNSIILKKYAEAFFGKNGLAGALFFWYVVVMVLRMVLFGHSIAVYDWIVIGVTLFFAAFASPFERLVSGERPLIENGVGSYIISGLVELIEVISTYLSNTVSFIRVGAFALSHAVLDFLILTLTQLCGGVGGILVLVAGNVIIVVLEGMIVAIQVIRLQYYEFFSKFFHETGREFRPFKFEYKNKI